MKSLEVIPNFKLPLSAATQTWGFFGIKRSGKTYAAGKLVESLLTAQVQVVILDWVGNWYGLRYDKSGKRNSQFEIPILGGERGEIPLEVGGGQLVADALVGTGSSAILDISHFRKGERNKFATDFAEQLYHLKKSNRTPMHLVLEEAHVYAPQSARGEAKGRERLLGAIEDIVRLGGNYGIGCSMISQRPQSINTEVRNMCEPLVVFRLIAAHERDAIGAWMKHMGVDSELESLSKLTEGECFFWSPAWLDKFARTRFLPKESFDASATPKVGQTVVKTSRLKTLDLGELKLAMAETIQKAEAVNPTKLQAKVAELQRQLTAVKAAPIAKVSNRDVKAEINAAVAIKAEERDNYWLGRESQIRVEVVRLEDDVQMLTTKLAEIARTATLNGHTPKKAVLPKPPKPQELRMPKVAAAPRAAASPVVARPAMSSGLAKMPRAFLTALAQHPSGLDRKALLIFAGYADSGPTCTCLRELNLEGSITLEHKHYAITSVGIAKLGSFEPLPQGQALRDKVVRESAKMESSFLQILFGNYPQRVPRRELLELAGYADSGPTCTALRKLVNMHWAERDREGFKASASFFDA